MRRRCSGFGLGALEETLSAIQPFYTVNYPESFIYTVCVHVENAWKHPLAHARVSTRDNTHLSLRRETAYSGGERGHRRERSQ